MEITMTADQVSGLMWEGNIGICTECGNEQFGAEPDAEGYVCEGCGERAVYGVEQLVIMNRITITD